MLSFFPFWYFLIYLLNYINYEDVAALLNLMGFSNSARSTDFSITVLSDIVNTNTKTLKNLHWKTFIEKSSLKNLHWKTFIEISSLKNLHYRTCIEESSLKNLEWRYISYTPCLFCMFEFQIHAKCKKREKMQKKILIEFWSDFW